MKIFSRTVLVIILIWGFFKFAPASVKNFIGEKTKKIFSVVVPDKTKKDLESAFLSPVEERTKLINRLEKNIASLEASFNETSSTLSENEKTATQNIIEEMKETVAEIKNANKNQTVANKVVNGAYRAVSDALGLDSENENPGIQATGTACQ